LNLTFASFFLTLRLCVKSLAFYPFVRSPVFIDNQSYSPKLSEIPTMRRPRFLLHVLLALMLSATAAFAQSTTETLETLGGYPCPDSDFTCVRLTVPLDHFADRSPTIEVIFAVLPATGERKGMFVTATGGPGTTGLASADSYTGGFDPSIPEHFDIVFFEQRGFNFQCVDAAAAYYLTDTQADTPEHEAALIDDAHAFADACIAETGAPDDTLAYYGTRQAVEDLDAFREAIGDDKLWLYGESYGTQYAQQYAAAHPDRLAGLILDGTVDATLSATEFLRQQAQAFNDVLIQTMDACDQDEACAADTGGDALAIYDDLAAELATAPISFSFPLASGKTEQRTFTLSDLENAAAGFLYAEGSRVILQRALAAASHGDLVPLARMAYNYLVIDPETLEPLPDETFSNALYYTVNCVDYPYFSGTPDERAEAYVRAGDTADDKIPRMSSIFYDSLPCAFWDGVSDQPRLGALTAEGIPTLVLGSTADPATPVGNGEAVYSRLSDGYLITTEGGPHVTFGYGNACPDDLITAFLVDDQMPAERETRCDGEIAYPYAAIAPVDASDYAYSLEALDSAYLEIYFMPDYYYWDTATPFSAGCTYGGSVTFEPSDRGAALMLDGCAFSQGFSMTGTGEDNFFDDFSTVLNVHVSGLAEGDLVYIWDAEGNVSVTGTYDGKEVDLSA
jgi:pimeloyl-ACP methyl ester carboxylesterase